MLVFIRLWISRLFVANKSAKGYIMDLIYGGLEKLGHLFYVVNPFKVIYLNNRCNILPKQSCLLVSDKFPDDGGSSSLRQRCKKKNFVLKKKKLWIDSTIDSFISLF